MLSVLGFLMVFTFMLLIITKKLSAITALIIVPLLFALASGFGPEIGPMMLDGLKNISATGIMLIFAILYFGIMIDTGLFDPLVNKILKTVKGDPLKVIVGTAIMSLAVSLDGDGSTTYIIVISAMLPVYKRIGINPLILPCITILCSGVMNILPWGGPTARAMTSLHLDSSVLFRPMIPSMFCGALWIILIAYRFGKKERERLGISGSEENLNYVEVELTEEKKQIRRPQLFWLNFTITMMLMAALIINLLPLSVLFIIGFAVAVIINYPKLEDQQERIAAYAANALSVASMVFAAGIFTGILSGTKMIDEMSQSVVSMIPESLGPHFPVITTFLGLPFTFFMNNDAFYFGVLPILTASAAKFGISAAEMGYASLLCQPVHLLSPLVPSTYLLVGLSGVNFGDHQRFTLKWAVGTTIVMFISTLLLGMIKL